MKRIIYLLLIILLFPGCFLWNGVTIYVTDSIDETIPATTTLLPFDLPIPTVTTSATTELENQGVLPSQIKEVILKDMVITITNPADQDFSFLDAIYVYIQDKDGNNEQEIAYLENISSTAKVITLNTKDVNLVDYIREGKYKLRVKVKVKKVLNHDVDVRIDLKFKILAKL